MEMKDLGEERGRFLYQGSPRRVSSFHVEYGTIGMVFAQQPETIFIKSGIHEVNPVSKVDDCDWRQIAAL